MNSKRQGLADVEYHSDGYGRESHPAINVKYQGRYRWASQPDDLSEREWNQITEWAWESACETFWNDATEIAHEREYSGVFSEGRSGGWLIPFYQGYPAKRMSRWQGQGGNLGYPRYPQLVDDDGRVDVGELQRFLALQRRVKALLDDVDEYLKDEVAFRLQKFRDQRDAERAAQNYVEIDG
jgi:hypothetical protein